ncbi:DUF2024 family protein [Shewanella sp. VB17]|uniref:DUF2024 family protein n=1 Tax=Shewanella sp. VB17 TaxID=2739432 RepID=UPI001565219F|nr:DUF2024 family protein [Shewanella sp. VB17]NRD75780.1 DUF2024 family protein [Shewanella sp. VB17]
MQVHVFDTHVNTSTGQYVHFDVLVDDSNKGRVEEYANIYLSSLDIKVETISQSRCDFCHSEMANPEVILAIERNGYYIIPLNVN